MPCKDCKFSVTETNQRFCRRFPPIGQIIPMPQQHKITGQVQVGMMTMATFPPVQDDHWCGEWVEARANIALS